MTSVTNIVDALSTIRSGLDDESSSFSSLQSLVVVPGVQGPQGNDGFQGRVLSVDGEDGVQGSQGFDGTQGMQGMQWYRGVQGDEGPQGLIGSQGVQGPQGVPVSNGFQGFQGYISTSGSPQDLQGFQGVQGLMGNQGPQGSQGFQGTQGWWGIALGDVLGPQGSQGAQGAQGISSVTSVLLQGYQGLGCQQKGVCLNVGTYTAIRSSMTMITSRLYLAPVYIPTTTVVSGACWYQTTAGSYTSNGENRVGLYSYNSGTLTLIASSADSSTLWTSTSNTFTFKAFSSNAVVTENVYFIGLLWNSGSTTTSPIIGTGTSMVNTAVSAFDFTNTTYLSAYYSGTTTLLSSITLSSTTSIVNTIWVGIF